MPVFCKQLDAAACLLGAICRSTLSSLVAGWPWTGCRLATEYDIVVTTYATLTADFQGRNSMAGNKGAGGKVEKQPIPVGVVP